MNLTEYMLEVFTSRRAKPSKIEFGLSLNGAELPIDRVQVPGDDWEVISNSVRSGIAVSLPFGPVNRSLEYDSLVIFADGEQIDSWRYSETQHLDAMVARDLEFVYSIKAT